MKFIASFLVMFLLSLTGQAAAPVYTAKATIQFKADAKESDPEKVLTASLPRGDDSVSVRRIPETLLFEVLASAPDPKAAAKRANQIALSLQSLFNDPDGRPDVVLIFQKAMAADATLQALDAESHAP